MPFRKPNESAVMDPAVFVPERVAVGLDELGINIKEVDWGESDVELFLIRQELGEIPADRHPPNQIITMTLVAAETGAVSLADAAERLQHKVGLWQEAGGWIERVMDRTGGFTNNVAYQIYKAALSGLQGWMFAHRQTAPEIKLVLARTPYCYGVKEQSITFTNPTGFAIVEKTLENLKGSAPGLIRVLIENRDAADWFGLLAAVEARDLTSGSLAGVKFNAESLTLAGESSTASKAGAFNTLCIKRVLNRNWQVICSSPTEQFAAEPQDWTHKGVRRMWMRVLDESEETGQVQYKLEWRRVGAPGWNENDIITSEAIKNFTKVDIGEVRLDVIPIGNQLWEWRLLGKTTGTSTVWVDYFGCFPTEQYLVDAFDVGISYPGSFLGEDGFTQAAGNLSGKKEEAAAREWITEGSAGDLQTGGGVLTRNTNTTEGRKAHIKGLEPTNVIVQCELEFGLIPIGGGIFMGIDCRTSASFASIRVTNQAESGYRAFMITPAGSKQISNLSPNVAYIMTVMTLGESQFTWLTQPGQILGAPQFACKVTEKVGTVGIEDFGSSTGNVVRNYRNFLAWEPEGGAAVTHSRRIELRSDMVLRQHPTKEAYGRITPEGRLLYLPPSRLEGRKARLSLMPSRGNFAQMIDTGNTHNMALEVKYFPAYHFAAEAS